MNSKNMADALRSLEVAKAAWLELRDDIAFNHADVQPMLAALDNARNDLLRRAGANDVVEGCGL